MFDVTFNASEPMQANFGDSQELTADFTDTIAVTDLDYNHLENHPSIEGHELVGDSTLEDIGVVIPEVPTKVSELENDAHYATRSELPTVPTNVSAFTNDAHYATVSQLPVVPTVVSAFQNDAHYATISQIPTVPTVISAFTNDVGYVTQSAIPEVPTKTSELTNDSGFITSADIPSIPSKTSELTNDSGFVTSADVPTKTSDLQNDSGFITSSDIPAIPSKTSDLVNDSDFTTDAAVTAALADKVDKVSGKGLSTNDYTTAEQTKLSELDLHSTDPIALTNEDLNNLHPLETTIYYGITGNTCTHKPTAITVNTFSLICLRVNATYMQQILIHPTSARAWRRLWTGTAWQSSGAWSELLYSYPAARTYNGLMSAADKAKLDDLAASTINVVDTKGLCGTVGATVTIQALMDAIANRV